MIRQAWGRDTTLARARASGFEVAASREALFETSDVLSLHIRLTPETRGIVAVDLARMKPTALYRQRARAELVAHGALEAACGGPARHGGGRRSRTSR